MEGLLQHKHTLLAYQPGANVLPWQEHISLKLQTLDKVLTSLKTSLGLQKVSRYPLAHCMLNEANQLSTHRISLYLLPNPFRT